MVENVGQSKSRTTRNVCMSVGIWKKHICQKDYISNTAKCSCETGKYLGSIIYNSVIKCNAVIEAAQTFSTKTVLTKSTSTKTVQTKVLQQFSVFY